MNRIEFLTAVKHNINDYSALVKLYQSLDDKSKIDKSLLIDAINVNNIFWLVLADDWKTDFDIVMAAVKKDGAALFFASDELKDNEKIVQAAINQWPTAINYASPRLYKIYS